MEKPNITKPFKGISTDNSPAYQTKDFYRFALNAVVETNDGNVSSLSCENSNESCYTLPEDYIPIGKKYMRDNSHVLFLVNKTEEMSEIGIVDKDNNYTPIVNADLGFKISHQIDCVYRLRRGCGRVIYWTDGLNKPRYFNIDKPNNFKDEGGLWDIEKFNLISTYKIKPEVSSFEIIETGQLPAGSYNFGIQYLDSDLNPTEFIDVWDTIIIYNDNVLAKPFREVRGSTNEITSFQNFGKTNKAIKINFSVLDESLPYYRIAILESNNGSGNISRVLYSQEVSTKVKSYVYTGDNALTVGTEAEVSQINAVIGKAWSIEQLENRLTLSNIEEDPINYCKLQKYASRVKADLILEAVSLTDLKQINNQKRGTVHTEKLGYMPGEIYAFDMHYVFDDFSVTPGLHIPGRNPKYDSQMSSDNVLENSYYREFNGCDSENSYWGVDSQGDDIVDTKIRHHRFPLRSEVNVPLLGTVVTTNEIPNELYQLNLEVTGFLKNTTEEHNGMYFGVTMNYQINGEPYSKIILYLVVNNGGTWSYYPTEDPSVVGEINPDPGTFYLTFGNEDDPLTELSASVTIQQLPPTVVTTTTYGTHIFGIKFSDVELPDISETGGKRVIGYLITRAERTESEKTILDTGIFTPIMKGIRRTYKEGPDPEPERDFASFGHLVPNISTDLILDDVFALTNPEFKFNQKEYVPTQFIYEGEYIVKDKILTEDKVQDVIPGTSYDSSIHKSREKDSDGFTLHTLSREHDTVFYQRSGMLAENEDIKEIFYMNALFGKTVKNSDDEDVDIYNMASDNKTGIVVLNKKIEKGTIPYFSMKRNLSDPYANYEVLPFFKQGFQYFEEGETTSSIELYRGDSYLSSMRYLTSMFFDTAIKLRKKKSDWYLYLIGLVGAYFAFNNAQAYKIYKELWEKGLRATNNDLDTQEHFLDYSQTSAMEDDEVQWFFDCLSNIWFESQVNMNWRMGSNTGLTDFLDSPATPSEDELNSYCVDKVTSFDTAADGGRYYPGSAANELYLMNNDYKRREKQKYYYTLPLEYECCNTCGEKYPHRTHWSEQSFQEELTDNYRKFLPNNYRDIEGNTGQITDTFTLSNNLFILTEEGLWHLPANMQERVTGDIVSFLGTGEFFSTPIKRIVDDESGNSAGTIHKWGVIKTPHGVFFPSENQGAIMRFDGQKLDPISSIEEFSWFKNNMTIQFDKSFYNQNHFNYAYRNNPSNRLGTGFISVYDPRRERIIFTKKDFIFGNSLEGDYDIRICDGVMYMFPNINETIETYQEQGWTYVGIQDCEMVFERLKIEEREVTDTQELPNNTDIHVFYDSSPGFCNIPRERLMESIAEWETSYKDSHPLWTGRVYSHQFDDERWLKTIGVIRNSSYNQLTDEEVKEKNIITAVFITDAYNSYHGATTLDTNITITSGQYNNYLNDLNVYNGHKSKYKTCSSILFPVTDSFLQGCDNDEPFNNLYNGPRRFLQHSLSALFGDNPSQETINAYVTPKNPNFSDEEWNILKTSLVGDSPYPNNPLINNGWTVLTDIYEKDINENNAYPIISAGRFDTEINKVITSNSISTTTIKQFTVMEYAYVHGLEADEEVLNILDTSWTRSFSLKLNSWTSFHSYMPNMYFNTSDNYYSWSHDSGSVGIGQGSVNAIKRYNKPYHYLTYNGIKYPFIVEYVSNSNPLITRVVDSIRFNTEATQYSNTFEDVVVKKNTTFTQAIFYNSKQCSGLVNLSPKPLTTLYLLYQVKKQPDNRYYIDYLEGDWSVNSIRDLRVNYNQPIFSNKIEDVNNYYYIDKVLNEGALDYNKNWYELENFRDKYLVIRFIFNNFADINLIFNHSIENESVSIR